MNEIYGTCDPTLHSVRDLLQQRIASKDELGASLCVNVNGKNILDLWGGHADVARTRPWQKDTITVVWSCSKVVTNLAALILVDRGLLDVNEKVATYWPEFGANGKEDVTVAHILSHSSGVPAWELPITLEEIYDTKKATEKLAAQAPWWIPGESSGYHLTNQGHLVGEIIRRITGRPLEQFVADEITGPLEADFQYGVPEEHWPRTADIISPPPLPFGELDPQSITAKAIAGSPFPAEASMTPGFRKTVSGANNGFSNARALARIGSIVSLDGILDGNKRIISASTIDKMLTEQIKGTDIVTFDFLRFGLGVALPAPQTCAWIPEGRIGFWGGWGGSMVIMDRDRRMTITYVMNNMSGRGTLGNDNIEAYVREIYRVIDGLCSSSA
ncbi:beta-lactamase domain-containing protein 2 [Aspergillus lentulus]|uniref:Beta-lactamase domain-containing protein 2 n=1 Tax=Aspergillus lentulus TaxID=293939 RepID=A0AAN4PP65_ASPLE|nr:beta-lactamase domain-containing protein 2 [Aspergillus lentulus]